MSDARELKAEAEALVEDLATKLEDMRGQRDFALEARTRTMEANAALQDELHRNGQKSVEVMRMVEGLEHDLAEERERNARLREALQRLVDTLGPFVPSLPSFVRDRFHAADLALRLQPRGTEPG